MINNDNSNPKPNNTNWQWPTNFTLTFVDNGTKQRFTYRENQNVPESVEQWRKEFKDDLVIEIENPQRTAVFWARHPFGRGFGAGVIYKIFSRSVEMPFRSGGMFGMISGVFNVATRPLAEKVNEKTKSHPEVQALSYLTTAAIPWAAAALTMNQLFIKTGKPMFRLTSGAAIGTAVLVEVFGYANHDLWKK